jgi:serine/threonine protein kinase
LVECNAVAIRIESLAPDITLAEVELLEHSSLTIQNQIGSGGYATVYKGKTQSGDLVAIKQLHFESEKEILGPEQYRERVKEFRREVSVMR